MKPVDQTRFGVTDGNCMESCVASILELDLADVPDLGTCAEGWLRRLNDWLAPKGLAYVEMSVPAHGPYARGVPCIMSGESPRFPDVDHACVGETERQGAKVVHDPHPSRAGLPKGAPTVGYFVTLGPDPMRAALAKMPEPLERETGQCIICGAVEWKSGSTDDVCVVHKTDCPWLRAREGR